jgi:hypothetical protein
VQSGQIEGSDMDDSSRKIVLIIATATAAALLFMAARYVVESKPEPVAATAQDTKMAAPVAPVAAPIDEFDTDPEQPDNGESFPEEDGFPPMGEPTVNIEQGGNSGNYQPPVATSPQPAQEQMPQAATGPEGYEANN